MAAQKGIDMLLKVSSDGTSGGTMNTLGGIRANSVDFNATPIDVTSADDSSRWRQLFAGGIRTASIGGSGIFKDDSAVEDLRDHVLNATESLAYLEFVIPDFGTVAGSFHVSNLSFSGNHDGEVEFSAQFESAGDVSWTAAV